MSASLRVHRLVVRRDSAPGVDAVRADGVADALRALDPPELPGLWFVPRLEVTASVAAGTNSRDAGRAIAEALLAGLARTMDAGPPRAGGVLWFPDRAAFLTQWLADLLHARTDGHWEYLRLGAATGSAAVRERAEAEPGDLLQALRRLRPDESDAVVALLAPADAAAVVHAVADGSAPSAAVQLATTVRALVDAGRLPDDPRRATLAVVLASADPASTAAAALARDLAAVALALRACRWSERRALAEALADGDWSGAAHLGAVTAATALAGWPASARSAAVGVIAAARHPGNAAPHDRTTEAADGATAPVHSALGGVFLLLPLLAELPTAEATEGWPTLGAVPPGRVLALLAVLGVLGPQRGAAVLADPWLRLGLGIGTDELAADGSGLGEWAASLTGRHLDGLRAVFAPVLARRAEAVPADLADPTLLLDTMLGEAPAEAVRLASCALLRELTYRLPGMATASADHVRRNLLGLDAHVSADGLRVVVELGHPPLNLLLSFAGMNRRTFTLDATGDRTWLLTSAR